MEVILASRLMLLLTIIVKTKSQAQHQFVHDGHCNGGYNGGCAECTFGRCRDQCAKIPEAGYFAYRAKPRGCSCYSAAAGCPDDDRYPDYNAYRIVREVVKDFKIRVYERRNNGETESKVAVEVIRIHSVKDGLFGELQKTLVQKYDELQQPNTTVNIFWTDKEDERIFIGDQQSLIIALDNMDGPIYNILVVFQKG